jgi:sugar lactone lactonase YvrE
MGTGLISTVAGGGRAYLRDGQPAVDAVVCCPSGLVFDHSGDLYIADGEDIFKVTTSTGIMTAVAGRDWFYYSGDGGPATDATLDWAYGLCLDRDGNLYVADFYNNRVRRVRFGASAIGGNSETGTNTGNSARRDSQ